MMEFNGPIVVAIALLILLLRLDLKIACLDHLISCFWLSFLSATLLAIGFPLTIINGADNRCCNSSCFSCNQCNSVVDHFWCHLRLLRLVQCLAGIFSSRFYLYDCLMSVGVYVSFIALELFLFEFWMKQ